MVGILWSSLNAIDFETWVAVVCKNAKRCNLQIILYIFLYLEKQHNSHVYSFYNFSICSFLALFFFKPFFIVIVHYTQFCCYAVCTAYCVFFFQIWAITWATLCLFFKVFCIMWSCLSKSCFLHHVVWKYGGIKLIIHPYWFGSNYGAHKALFSSKLIITFLMNKSSHPSKFKMLGVTLDLHFVWIKGIWRVWEKE